MEIIVLIVRNLRDLDLLRLTQVNRHMADRTCELYMARRNIRLVGSSVSLRGAGFQPLSVSVWRRSPAFKGRRSIMCWFDSEPAEAKSQIQDLKMFFAAISEPICHTIHLRHLTPVNPETLLSILDSIDRSGIPNVEVHAHMISHQGITITPISSYVYLRTTKTILLRFVDLSVANWALLLKHIVAPSLEKIAVEGDPSMFAISQFLRRHDHVSVVEFTRISNPRHRLNPSFHPLYLPALHSLSGTLCQVIPLLHSLSSPPQLVRLHLDSVVDLPYGTWVGEMMHCVALCKSVNLLSIGFAPSSKYSSHNRIGIASSRHRKQTQVSTSVVRLTIEVRHLSDEAVLVCSYRYLLVLISLNFCLFVSGMLRSLDDIATTVDDHRAEKTRDYRSWYLVRRRIERSDRTSRGGLAKIFKPALLLICPLIRPLIRPLVADSVCEHCICRICDSICVSRVFFSIFFILDRVCGYPQFRMCFPCRY
jgi:hypothetical protein